MKIQSGHSQGLWVPSRCSYFLSAHRPRIASTTSYSWRLLQESSLSGCFELVSQHSLIFEVKRERLIHRKTRWLLQCTTHESLAHAHLVHASCLRARSLLGLDWRSVLGSDIPSDRDVKNQNISYSHLNWTVSINHKPESLWFIWELFISPSSFHDHATSEILVVYFPFS